MKVTPAKLFDVATSLQHVKHPYTQRKADKSSQTKALGVFLFVITGLLTAGVMPIFYLATAYKKIKALPENTTPLTQKTGSVAKPIIHDPSFKSPGIIDKDKTLNKTPSRVNAVNIEALKEIAESDDGEQATNAALALAVVFQCGKGVPKSDKDAFKYYKQAYEGGIDSVGLQLGILYEYGKGVEKSDSEAFKAYKKAAEELKDIFILHSKIALMYEQGRGTEKSDANAFKNYKIAADLGDPISQCKVCIMYENGQGIEKSSEEAKKYAKLALDQGWGEFLERNRSEKSA